MVQYEVPRSRRDFSLRDSIGGRKEDKSISERFKSAEIFPVELKPLFFRNILENSKLFAGRSKSSEILEVKPMLDLLASNVLKR